MLRLISQHVFFFILTFSGRLGISLGPSLPCLSCPYVTGCGGVCYLRMLQSPMGGLGMNLAVLFTQRGLQALAAFGLFVVLVALFGQSWCGWTCPFGLLQDYAARLRNKLRIREAILSDRAMFTIKIFKCIFFVYLLIIPVLITLGLAHSDLTLPYCAICPVKLIMPLITGDPTYLNLDFTNSVLLTESVVLIVFSGLVLVGMFFKTRFFCLICPMSLLISLFRPIFLLRLIKEPAACLGCGNCRRVCPTTIDKSAPLSNDLKLSTKHIDAVRGFAKSCQGCFNCAQCCSTEGSLGIKFGPKVIFRASRSYAAKLLKRKSFH